MSLPLIIESANRGHQYHVDGIEVVTEVITQFDGGAIDNIYLDALKLPGNEPDTHVGHGWWFVDGATRFVKREG